jgi:hypothetical protein
VFLLAALTSYFNMVRKMGKRLLLMIVIFLSDEELRDLADSLVKIRDLVIKIYRNHYDEIKE